MTSTINASLSAGVVVTSDTSGSLAFQSNGTTIATISSTGLQQNVGAPAFSAYASSNQSITTNTYTKIQINTEEFDTASCYNNTGSTVGSIPAYAFLPNVAGYYQVQVVVYPSTATTNVISAIYKNGSLIKRTIARGDSFSSEVTALISMNGTTDYLEGYGLLAGTSPSIQGGSDLTFFQAVLVRSA